MQAKAKDKRPVGSSYVPTDVLANLVKGGPRPVAPEIAAERAANRIIRAIREGEKEGLKKTDNA